MVDIVGSYRVTTVERRTPEGELRHPFGVHPDGVLVYGADGMTAAVVGASGREVLAMDLLDESVGATADELAGAFRSAYGFAGTYEVVGEAVHHRILVSTVANWVGTEQVRPFSIDGDALTLRPPGWRVVAYRCSPAQDLGTPARWLAERAGEGEPMATDVEGRP